MLSVQGCVKSCRFSCLCGVYVFLNSYESVLCDNMEFFRVELLRCELNGSMAVFILMGNSRPYIEIRQLLLKAGERMKATWKNLSGLPSLSSFTSSPILRFLFFLLLFQRRRFIPPTLSNFPQQITVSIIIRTCNRTLYRYSYLSSSWHIQYTVQNSIQ